MKQAFNNKVLGGVVEQSVCIFDGFINPFGCDLMGSIRVRSEKAYCDNLVQCPVPLAHVSVTGATSMSWRSDIEDNSESSLSARKGRFGGKTILHRRGGKSRGRR